MERQRKTIESGRTSRSSLLLPGVVLALTLALGVAASLRLSADPDAPNAGEATPLTGTADAASPPAISAPLPVPDPLPIEPEPEAMATPIEPTEPAVVVVQPFIHAPPEPVERVAPEPAPVVPEGRAGLVEALRRGELRPGSRADIQRWVTAANASGQSIDATRLLEGHVDVFVIQKDFTVPGGLHGANLAFFVLEPGAPFPRGDLGHSLLLDLQSGSCSGSTCRMMLSP